MDETKGYGVGVRASIRPGGVLVEIRSTADGGKTWKTEESALIPRENWSECRRGLRAIVAQHARRLGGRIIEAPPGGVS